MMFSDDALMRRSVGVPGIPRPCAQYPSAVLGHHGQLTGERDHEHALVSAAQGQWRTSDINSS